jgi:hypothetical protein
LTECRDVNTVPEEALSQLERFAWLEFAQPRFGMGSRMELRERGVFLVRTDATCRRLREQARRAGQELDCSLIRMRLLAVRGLEQGCAYCGELIGVEGVEIVLDTPAGRTNSRPFRLANLACACSLCAQGKGSLSGDEWRDVLAALRAAEPVAALAARRSIAVGRNQEGGIKDGRTKVLPRG